MKLKQMIAVFLLAASLCSLVLPISAAESSFSDISDQKTALNADVLRLMGVVSGTGGNRFNPSATLTRAQFCSMAVYYMGLGDQVVLHTTRTIFSDVTARHWGIGQINLAASTTIGGENSGERLISGIGNGKFAPDDPITYAQAVTILLRILGYTDQQTNGVWPQGYLSLGQSLGLTSGLSLSGSSNVTRAQAAQLFVQALSTKTQGGSEYYSVRAAIDGGAAHKNVILLASDVEADDKTGGAIRTSMGTYLPAIEGSNPRALQGQRGVLLLNSKNEIITFLPDSSASVIVTLSGSAQAAYLTGTNGTRYSISSSTPAYTAKTEKDTSYGDIWTDLSSGIQVTLFLDNGKVVGLFYGGMSLSEDAVFVTGRATAATFTVLTGGATNYTIQKNRQTITMSEIQPYDVVTYDSMSNLLIVSELRLTCVVENASPNVTTPSSVSALGNQFEVLESAWGSSDGFTVGGQYTLFLTADGKVAAIKKPSSDYRSNAIGLADGSSVAVPLPAGGMLTLTGSKTFSNANQFKLVSASSYVKNEVAVSRLTNSYIPGDFNVGQMTLGRYPVAAGVALYEQVADGVAAPLSMSSLDMDSILSSDIALYHVNGSGYVDVIVLDGVTGDTYTYGRLVESWDYGEDSNKTETETEEDTDSEEADTDSEEEESRSHGRGNRRVTVENSGKRDMPEINKLLSSGIIFKTGDFGGASASNVAMGDAGMRVSSIIVLKPITNISRTSFFVSNGKTYVNVNNQSYQVSEQVECYNSDSETWFTGSDPLAQIRAYSDNLTIYIDPYGQKVRIVTTA